MFIDCVYTNIIFSDYSLVINRAVCGLDKKITNDYSNIIYKFSDKWEDDISNQVINTERLKTENVLLGYLDDIKILIKVNLEKEIDTDKSKIIFELNNKKYKLSNHKNYLVLDIKDSNKLVRIDEVIDEEEKSPFIQYDSSKIKEFFTNFKNEF